MNQFLASGAATVVVLLFAATSATATALPIRIDACTSSPCNNQGGSVDVSLSALMADNALYYRGNLEILRRHIDDESIDLVYLDPPFNYKVSMLRALNCIPIVGTNQEIGGSSICIERRSNRIHLPSPNSNIVSHREASVRLIFKKDRAIGQVICTHEKSASSNRTGTHDGPSSINHVITHSDGR
jgi:hypothetical protein